MRVSIPEDLWVRMFGGSPSPQQVVTGGVTYGTRMSMPAQNQGSQTPPPANLPLTDPDKTVTLPSEVTDVVAGGRGRYLLLSLGEVRTLAVFDMKEAKVRKYLSIGSERFLVAGGATRFVVVDKEAQTITRWNYEQLDQPELEVPAKGLFADLSSIAMGQNSEGPLALMQSQADSPIRLHDLSTLEMITVTIKDSPRSSISSTSKISAFDDGQTFRVASSSSLHTFRLRGTTVFADMKSIGSSNSAYRTNGNGLYEISDRDLVFRDGTHVRASQVAVTQLASIAPQGSENHWVAPASPPGFWFGVSIPSMADSYVKVTMQFGPDPMPFETMYLKGVGSPGAMRALSPGRRVAYSSAEKVLAVVTAQPPTVITKALDVESLFAKSQREALFITSTAPPTYSREVKYAYQIETKSSQGGVTYRLESGPSGMTASPTGLVEWLPPDTAPKSLTAIVSVSDKSGKQIFHNFDLDLVASTANVVMTRTESGAVVTTAAASDRTEIGLPGPIDQYAIGGSGRYLVARIVGLRQIAVVDVKERKLLKLLPVDDDSPLIAAGATKFVVLQRDKGILSRWSFAKLERELSVPTSDKYSVLAMGSASEGPILAGIQRHDTAPVILDLRSLKPPVGTKAGTTSSGSTRSEMGNNVAASSNGRVFGSWRNGTSPSGLYSVMPSKNSINVLYEHESVGAVVPSADGNFLYTDSGIYTNQCKPVNARGERENNVRPISYMPSETGNFYLSWPRDGVDKSAEQVISLHVQGNEKPIATLPQFDLAEMEQARSRRNSSSNGRAPWYLYRPRLLPQGDAVLYIDEAADKITLYHVTVDQLVLRSTSDILFVKSTPPSVYKPGEPFSYQIFAASKKGNVTFRLDSAPDGMTLSPTGLLTWKPGAGISGDQTVIVSLGDAPGREIFHTFKIVSDSNADDSAVASATPMGATTVGAAPVVAVATPTSAGAPSVATPAIGGVTSTIKFPAPVDDMVVGGSGRYLVAYIKQLRQIAVVDLSARKVVKYVSIDDDLVQIAAGATKFVVMLGTKGVLHRYNLADATRELTAAIDEPFLQMTMAAGGEGPICYALGSQNRSSSHVGGFLDLRTLKPIEFKRDDSQPSPRNGNRGHDGEFRFGYGARFSTDNSTLALGLVGVTFSGRTVQIPKSPNGDFRRFDSAAIGLPSADGRFIYYNGAMFTSQGTRIGVDNQNGSDANFLLPAITGPTYLKFTNLGSSFQSGDKQRSVSLHIEGDLSPVFTLSNFELPDFGRDFYPGNHTGMCVEKRIFLVPELSMIAVVMGTNDELELRRFDLDEELKKSDIDFLFAASVPPANVAVGSKLSYQVVVKSKRGGVKYRLEAGPGGMAISPTGLVSWQAPPKADDEDQVAIVAISDASGQETFHTFKLKVVPRADAGPAAVAVPRPSGTAAVDPDKGIPATQPVPAAMPSATAATAKPIPSATGASTKPTVTADTSMRKWTSRDGAFSIEATLVEVRDGKARLKRPDGTVIDVGIDKLGQAERDYLESKTAK